MSLWFGRQGCKRFSFARQKKGQAVAEGVRRSAQCLWDTGRIESGEKEKKRRKKSWGQKRAGKMARFSVVLLIAFFSASAYGKHSASPGSVGTHALVGFHAHSGVAIEHSKKKSAGQSTREERTKKEKKKQKKGWKTKEKKEAWERNGRKAALIQATKALSTIVVYTAPCIMRRDS